MTKRFIPATPTVPTTIIASGPHHQNLTLNVEPRAGIWHGHGPTDLNFSGECILTSIGLGWAGASVIGIVLFNVFTNYQTPKLVTKIILTLSLLGRHGNVAVSIYAVAFVNCLQWST